MLTARTEFQNKSENKWQRTEHTDGHEHYVPVVDVDKESRQGAEHATKVHPEYRDHVGRHDIRVVPDAPNRHDVQRDTNEREERESESDGVVPPDQELAQGATDRVAENGKHRTDRREENCYNGRNAAMVVCAFTF